MSPSYETDTKKGTIVSLQVSHKNVSVTTQQLLSVKCSFLHGCLKCRGSSEDVEDLRIL